MPQPAPSQGPAVVIASLVVAAVVAAMLSAWTWALGRLARGRPLLPPPVPRVVPWGAGSILTLLLAWFLTQNAVALVHYRITGRYGTSEAVAVPAVGPAIPQVADPADQEKPSPWTERDKLVITAVVAVLLIPQIIVILAVTARARPEDLGLTRRDLGLNLARGAVACLLLAPICYGLNVVLTQIWTPREHDLITMVRERFTVENAVLAVVAAVVLAPLVEELTFRGVLLPWVEGLFAGRLWPGRRVSGEIPGAVVAAPPEQPVIDREAPPAPIGPFAEVGGVAEPSARPVPWPASPGGAFGTVPDDRARWMANIVTSMVFALLHAPQWPAPLPLFVLSLGLGVLIQRTGSLWAPIALHASFNGLSTVALLLALLLGGDKPAEEAIPRPAGDVAAVLDGSRHRVDRVHTFFRQVSLGRSAAGWYGWIPLPAGYDR